jgi:hypothetical protein
LDESSWYDAASQLEEQLQEVLQMHDEGASKKRKQHSGALAARMDHFEEA